jgi:hypothetical protein
VASSGNSSNGNKTVKVAFVGATGRSGSTLVARVLGGAPGACSVGELCWIWNYGVLNDRPCGCGEPFSACPFWTAVGELGFGGWQQLDAQRLNGIRKALVQTSSVRSLWPGRPGPPDLDEYVGTLGRLYRAIAEVSGASVVIDNSKQVAAALVVRRVPEVDLRLLHLVRSPHGVAYSWTKHVSRGDMGGNEMRRRGPGRTALRWDADNLLFERLGRAGTPRLLLRYEDFVTDARTSTAKVLDFLDEPASELDYVGPDWADLGVEHSVWGNPMRGREGREQLRPDEGWRTGLAQRDARLVSALTAPVRGRFAG